jgi:hypothetical protein
MSEMVPGSPSPLFRIKLSKRASAGLRTGKSAFCPFPVRKKNLKMIITNKQNFLFVIELSCKKPLC